jgi:hypothetical protein
MPLKSFDLTVARAPGALRVNVTSDVLSIEQCDSPVTLTIVRDQAERVTLRGPRRIHARDCKPIGEVLIENEAGSGVLELRWSGVVQLGDPVPFESASTEYRLAQLWAPRLHNATGLLTLIAGEKEINPAQGASGTTFAGVITAGGGAGSLLAYHGCDATATAQSYRRANYNWWAPLADMFSALAGGFQKRSYGPRSIAYRMEDVIAANMGASVPATSGVVVAWGFLGEGNNGVSNLGCSVVLAARPHEPNWRLELHRYNAAGSSLHQAVDTGVPHDALQVAGQAGNLISVALEVGYDSEGEPYAVAEIAGREVARFSGRTSVDLTGGVTNTNTQATAGVLCVRPLGNSVDRCTLYHGFTGMAFKTAGGA